MTATIVIVANERVPLDQLNLIIEQHRLQTFAPKVAVAYIGNLDGKIEADIIVNVPGPGINLGLARNSAAKACPADWYLFADADTYYTADMGKFIGTSDEALRGRWRSDVAMIGGSPLGDEYHVMAAPMIISDRLLRDIGGYHEKYINYGHDDSDIDHKLADYGIDVRLINTHARHVLHIHNFLDGDNWDRGRGANRGLFESRIAKSIAERIEEDRAVFSSH